MAYEMISEITETSFFVAALIKFDEMCSFILLKANKMLKSSCIYSLLKSFLNSVKIILEISFLGKLSRVDWQNTLVLNSSYFIHWLSGRRNLIRDSIICYFKRSAILDAVVFIKSELYNFPIQIIGGITIVVLLADMLFSVFIKKIIIFNLFMQFLILFISLTLILCIWEWRNAKGTSDILKIINRYCKDKI